MTKRRKSLTRKIAAAATRERAITALLTHPTLTAAAAAAAVGESTLRKWLRQPAFASAYAAARRAVLEQVIGTLVSATSDALLTLRRNLTCGQPGAEVRAAVALIDAALRGEEMLLTLGELAEMRQQVTELLAAQKAREGQE